MASEASDSARKYGRTAGLLTVALGTAGALTYLFFAVASHSLSEEDYGQIVVLWSVSFLVVSILFRPVEQLLARTVADLQEKNQSIRHAMRVAVVIQAGLATVFVLVAIASRTLIEDELFEGQALLFWVLISTVIAFSASYFVRGFFAGSRRMGWYAAVLIVEGAVRLALALAVTVGIANGADLVAIAIAISPLAGLVIVPFAIQRTAQRAEQHGGIPERTPAIEGAPEFTLAQGGGFAAAVLLIMISEQILLNGGVLFVRASEGVAAAGFIFNVLMIVRAPVVLFQAVAASLLPHLTRLRSRGDESSDEAFELSIKLTLLVIMGFAGAVLVGLLAVGPAVMQIAFGDNFQYDRLGLSLVALGMALYLSAATLNQAALAQGQVRRAASCWAASSVVFVLINLAPATEAVRRVEVGFLVSAAVLFLSLFLLYRHPKVQARYEVLPGSSSEVEARLAAADDVI